MERASKSAMSYIYKINYEARKEVGVCIRTQCSYKALPNRTMYEIHNQAANVRQKIGIEKTKRIILRLNR